MEAQSKTHNHWIYLHLQSKPDRDGLLEILEQESAFFYATQIALQSTDKMWHQKIWEISVNS